ncbi:MAG: NFACT family protein [Candidatus ainarchaeum sp.]|nr:NFACT family protein [Candidatus ainarchaeum sp.]
MQINISNLTLKHIIQENQILINGFINKIQTTDDNLLKLKIHTKEGDKNILITQNSFFISNKSEPAKQNPGGFSAFLKKYLFNQRIISITQQELDRIIIFEFPSVYLILELFAKGNIILCDKEMRILKAMRKEKWKDRELAKEQKYNFPSSRGQNPLKLDENEYIKKMKQNTKTVFGATLELINIAPLILEFIFDELKIDKKKDSNTTSDEELKKISSFIQELYSSPIQKIFVFENTLYTIDLKKNIQKEYSSINEALNELTQRNFEQKEVVKKEQKKIDYKKQQEDFEQLELELKEKGNMIYLKYQELNELIKQINKLIKNGFNEKQIKEKLENKIIKIKEINIDKNIIKIEI